MLAFGKIVPELLELPIHTIRIIKFRFGSDIAIFSHDLEQMQMCILPIEASLKDAVEFGKGDLSWNHNLSPDIHPLTGQLNSENKGSLCFYRGFGWNFG